MQPRVKPRSMRPALAAGMYLGLLILLAGSTYAAFANVNERRAALNAAETLLRQIEGRSAPAGKAVVTGFSAGPGGSPFLEGATVTVAGAALLQRIAGAVTK